MDPFDSSKLLIGRARSHLQELAVWLFAYSNNAHREFVRDTDPETGLTHYKFRILTPLPLVTSGALFDLINNIRSALDHAVYDAAAQIGGRPKPKSTKFPFGISAENAAGNLEKAKAEVPVAIHAFLLGFRPYPASDGGDETLFALNELRNQKIHRTLEVFASAGSGVGFNELIPHGATKVDLCCIWDKEKLEMTYLISDSPDLQVEVSPQLGFRLPILPGGDKLPAPQVLADAIQKVEAICISIEKETARILAERG